MSELSDDEMARSDPNLCEHGWSRLYPQPCPECECGPSKEFWESPDISGLGKADAELTANSWLVIETDGFPHVVPYEDLKEHDVDGACWCEPYEDDGVIVHNSMDKRERYERGEMIPL